jgi:hypothetical protein
VVMVMVRIGIVIILFCRGINVHGW